jgi:uncharacterized protein
MLIRFVVSNFLSFDEEKEFNMLPGPFKNHKHHIYDIGKVKVLKAAAIYGANGAGKSNFIKAVDFFFDLIKAGEVKGSIDDKKFKLNPENKQKPTSFEMEFYINAKIYSYGISLNDVYILEEWLYESGITTEDKCIFKRKRDANGKQTLDFAPEYLSKDEDKLLIKLLEDRLLKESELLLSKENELKIPEIHALKEWINFSQLTIFPSTTKGRLMVDRGKQLMEFANSMLQSFDTGVIELKSEKIDFDEFFGQESDRLKGYFMNQMGEHKNVAQFETPSGLVLIERTKDKFLVNKVSTLHRDIQKNDIIFNMNNESDGTLRLIDFLFPFWCILNFQGVILIDEIDQSIHPSLLKEFVKKFMDDGSAKGQLIFTTHQSNLLDLDLFRQDEIWFAEKNREKSNTEMYSLSEFKPRFDLDIRKGYLNGRFGAIPFLGNLKDLNWHKFENA